MNPLLGMIFLFGGSYAPMGYALCNGQLLPIAENQALFAVIGTVYGGDGMKTFALPKLAAPANATYIIATQGVFPSRD